MYFHEPPPLLVYRNSPTVEVQGSIHKEYISCMHMRIQGRGHSVFETIWGDYSITDGHLIESQYSDNRSDEYKQKQKSTYNQHVIDLWHSRFKKAVLDYINNKEEYKTYQVLEVISLDELEGMIWGDGGNRIRYCRAEVIARKDYPLPFLDGCLTVSNDILKLADKLTKKGGFIHRNDLIEDFLQEELSELNYQLSRVYNTDDKLKQECPTLFTYLLQKHLERS